MPVTVPPSRALAAALCGLAALPAAAAAADGESTPLNLETAQRATAETAGSGGGAIARTIVGLAVVVALIYGLHWVLKQVKSAREESASGAGLAPLATLPLGPNRALHLVRAGSEVVLVGAADRGVTAIRTYSEDEARALGLLAAGGDGDGPPAGPPAARRSWLDELRARTVVR